MQLRNEKGVALVLTLMIIVVLLTLGSIFVLRAINEWNSVNRDRQLSQAYYISEGGAEMALSMLDTLINNYMLNTVNVTNPSTVISATQGFVASGNGLGLLTQYVKNNGIAQLVLSADGTEASYTGTTTVLGAGTYRFDIVITEKLNPSAGALDQWDFPYYYRIKSTGMVGGNKRKAQLFGDFSVRVQRDNFAKYALFTNQQSMPSGTNVWFTNKTNFAGPLHTNGRVNIALNPSGVFDGLVTQHETTARFYNNGSPLLLDADANSAIDVPTFNAGFTRGASSIALSSAVQKQNLVDQATGGTVITTNGIYVPNNGTELTGGIYVQGDAAVSLGVNGSDDPVYTITQGATTRTVTVNRATQQTTVQSGAVSQTYSGIPDGVDDVGTILFVNGNVNSLAGTVQKDTQLTISSESDIVITNHVLYSEYNPAQGTSGQSGYVPPDASGAENLLGLVTWNGNVRVSTAAPNNLNVHGTILAQSGEFQVDNYTDQTVGSRGTATLLGGVISDYYGAFGLFNGATGQQIAGYGRNFVYDDRLKLGSAPPYFPSLNTFIAFTNDIVDKITLQVGGF